MHKHITAEVTESKEYPGYYHTSLGDTIILTPDGRFKATKDGRDLKVYGITKRTPYPAVWLPGVGSRSAHRSLAIAFLKCPGKPKDYQVNHIDGDKSNYDLSNLEWLTPKADLDHAFKTGLRSDNNPVLAKDLHSGEIIRFHSQAECAKFLRTTPAMLHHFIKKSKKKYPFKERWDVIIEGGKWSKLSKIDLGMTYIAHNIMVITISKDGKEVVLYEDLKNMSVCLGVSEEVINYWLHSGVATDGSDMQVMRFIDYSIAKRDESIIVEAPTKITKRRNNFSNDPIPIIVTNTRTGEVTNYDSVEEFSKVVNFKRKSIQKAIWKKDKWRHYHIQYIRDAEESE